MNDDSKRTVSVIYQNEMPKKVGIKLSRVACNLIDERYGKGQRTRVVQEIFNANVVSWKSKLGVAPAQSSQLARKKINDHIAALILGLALED